MAASFGMIGGNGFVVVEVGASASPDKKEGAACIAAGPLPLASSPAGMDQDIIAAALMLSGSGSNITSGTKISTAEAIFEPPTDVLDATTTECIMEKDGIIILPEFYPQREIATVTSDHTLEELQSLAHHNLTLTLDNLNLTTQLQASEHNLNLARQVMAIGDSTNATLVQSLNTTITNRNHSIWEKDQQIAALTRERDALAQTSDVLAQKCDVLEQEVTYGQQVNASNHAAYLAACESQQQTLAACQAALLAREQEVAQLTRDNQQLTQGNKQLTRDNQQLRHSCNLTYNKALENKEVAQRTVGALQQEKQALQQDNQVLQQRVEELQQQLARGAGGAGSSSQGSGNSQDGGNSGSSQDSGSGSNQGSGNSSSQGSHSGGITTASTTTDKYVPSTWEKVVIVAVGAPLLLPVLLPSAAVVVMYCTASHALDKAKACVGKRWFW